MTDATGAALSPCGRYRFRLWRRWNFELPRMCWVMLNPSTADAANNDATIRRCLRFAERFGFGGMEVVNLFAWRATKPTALKRCADPVGPGNDAAILNAARGVSDCGGQVVCAWGGNAKGTGRDEAVLQLLHNDGIPTYALRVNGDGTPAHPLMLPADLELQGFGWQ